MEEIMSIKVKKFNFLLHASYSVETESNEYSLCVTPTEAVINIETNTKGKQMQTVSIPRNVLECFLDEITLNGLPKLIAFSQKATT